MVWKEKSNGFMRGKQKVRKEKSNRHGNETKDKKNIVEKVNEKRKRNM